jgi:glycosyltransferase involved in cell wall biosynthesis
MLEPTLTPVSPTLAPDADARRVRVMQVITHLGLGGAERVAFTVMRGLLCACEFELFAVLGVQRSDVGAAFRTEAEAMKLRLFTGTRVPVKYGGMLLAGRQLAKAVKAAQPEVIHLHTEIPESVYAAAVTLDPSIGAIPLVRTIHNTVYWTPWRRMGRWCERRMPRPFIAAVSEAATAAFAQLRQESGAGPLPAPPRIIFNGVEVQQMKPPRESGTSSPIQLLFAGRFEDQKGADLLPEIIRRVRPPRPCQLTICGRGRHEPAIRELAAHPPSDWTVHLQGPVSNLSSRLPSFDLLLMPSRFEGLSIMAIESLLVGLPIVATRAPGLRDGFPADYPWMAPPGDAAAYAELLNRVLAQPNTWSTVAALGNQFARDHFDPKVMCDGYRQLYRDVIALSSR